VKPTWVKVYGPPFDYRKQEQRMQFVPLPPLHVELFTLMRRIFDLVELNLYGNCKELKRHELKP